MRISAGLFLGCLTTGAQWDLLQVFAWGRMIANYSHNEDLGSAIGDTFSGRMCSICRMVAKAHQQERSRAPMPSLERENKVLFFFEAAPVVAVKTPLELAWRPTEARILSQGRAMPPVPPPRTEGA